MPEEETSSQSTQGAYNKGSYSSQGGSQFASKSPRMSKYTLSYTAHMGDPGSRNGAYTSGVHAGAKETLGCRSARSYNKDSARGAGRFNSSSARLSGAALGPEQARDIASPPGSARGGPGEYDPMTTRDGAHLTTSSFASPRGSLGTTARFGSPSCGSARGSAKGTPRFSSPTCNSARSSAARSSSAGRSPRPSGAATYQFASGTQLGGHVRRRDTPGVGAYDTTINLLKSGHNYSRNGASMFASAEQRGSRSFLRGSRSTDAIVGPGYYDLSIDGDGRGSIQARAKAKINKKAPGFGSSNPRKAYYE
jgi:hypothetical protein